MSCKEVGEFVDAYVDKELDVISSSHFEQHLRECAACRAKYEQYAQMHDSVRGHMEYFQPPEGLEQRLRASLSGGPAEIGVPGRADEMMAAPASSALFIAPHLSKPATTRTGTSARIPFRRRTAGRQRPRHICCAIAADATTRSGRWSA